MPFVVLSALPLQVRGQERVNGAVHNPDYVAGLESGAVVLYQCIRLERIGTYLVAPFC